MSIEGKGRVVLLGSIVFYLSTRDEHTLAYVVSQRPNSFNLFGARNNTPAKSYIILFDFVCCGYRPTQGRDLIRSHRVKVRTLGVRRSP